ncbi:phage tail assembly [Lactococcus lactis subsp. lactis]|nr:phage tail assembly [Lactococcus lactis subsp. lactis]
MLINILDVNLQKVAFLSNDVPGLPSYYDDEFHEYRDQGAATFKFTVKKVINNKLQSYARFLNGQSYFSFQIDGNDYLMTPASEQAIHETSEEISFFCVSLDRELMSEQANPLVNTSSHNIQFYFDQMGLISNTQITIGINEVSNLTRTINYDGQETKLARLISVIGNFDAEFEFITKLNNDGSLNSVTLNIYKENDGLNIQGVGKKRDDVRLIFGENIQAVERDVSTEGFLNATTVTGADNLNWNSASFSYINADGVEEFYKRAGSDTAFAPLSAKIYPAQLSKDKDDIWTRIDFTTDYKNVNDMWAYAVRQFKQYAYHQVSYTVTPSSKLVNAEIGDGPPLAKGDTVIIQDNNYIDIDGNVGLLLSARVSEKIVSETHPENNKLIFSNYKKLKNEASADIQAIVNQLVDAATPYIGSIYTTNGTQFKNGTGSTTLSAHIFKGSATTETTADSYEWSKDGTVVANVQEITVDASGVVDKAVYSFKATVGGKVVASQSVTITNVNDGKGGADGKTSYTHVAWANNITGTDGFTTVYPNLNLLDGTRDFSGDWSNIWWQFDGTYKGLKVKKVTGSWNGLHKNFTAPKDGIYTFSAYVKNSGSDASDASVYRFVQKNDAGVPSLTKLIGRNFGWLRDNFSISLKAGDVAYVDFNLSEGSNSVYWTAGHKWEPGSTATPYMPSSSEATTADWPSYIGQYSDFTATASTDPTKYAPWTIFKGNDGKDGIAGKDGTGIQTTTITYAGSTSGTTAPTSGWTSTIPTVAAGSYLWTKTIWAYTDNTSKTGYSVAKMGNDGSNGDPGKIVSDTEPTTRFKGLTWKYSGTADLTASDGTVILSGTEYYWSGTNWILSEINAHNINGNNLTITDGEFSSTIIDGPVQIQTEIKDDHLLIYKMDTSHNEIHTIALKSDSGLGMTYQNSDTGEYTSAGVNFQGLFMQNNITNEFARLTPQGTKLSTDVPWTKLSLMNNFTGNIEYAIINGTVYISASGVGVPAMTAGQWKQAAQLPTGSSAIPIRANRITAGDSGDGLSWALLSNQAGGLFIRCSANKAATANLFNATLPYPIG